MMKRRIWIALVCLVLATALLTTGMLFARYAATWGGKQGIAAEQFFFESDYLTEDATAPVYTVYGESVSFRVTASEGAKFTVKAGGETLNAEDGSYTLTGSGRVTVEATCTAPYSKTLKAAFQFQPAQGGYYTLKNGDNHVVLDIYTGDAAYSGTISYGEGLAPDNTNPLMDDWIGGTSGMLSLDANAHYELIFFKNDTASYEDVNNGTLDSTITLSQAR